MTRITFDVYKGRAEHKFTCPMCEKKNRKRVFVVEYTVSPFNTHEDGRVKNWFEVTKEAQAKAEQELKTFLHEPLCATCEFSLPSHERREVENRREQMAGRGAAERGQEAA